MMLKIGVFEYQVVGVDKLYDHDGVHLFGKIDYGLDIITLDSALTSQRKEVVIWHEILHALMEHSGLEVDNPEVLTKVLSIGIVQVLRDNPELMKK